MLMPEIGLGTFNLLGTECSNVVTRAAELGYRHFDTAQMYNNETEVGAGLRAASVPRDQIFVVTKIHQDRFRDGTALQSARDSIRRLGVGPADLILCHWPPRTHEPEAVMDVLLAVRDEGLTGAIGLSNFNVSQMQRAAACGPVLANQVEFHPLLDQTRLMKAAAQVNVRLTAYRPIIKGKALKLPVILEIAAETARPAAAVVLRWVIQQGVAAICKTSNTARLRKNLEAVEFELSEDQMGRITAMTTANERYCDMAGWSPDWEG